MYMWMWCSAVQCSFLHYAMQITVAYGVVPLPHFIDSYGQFGYQEFYLSNFPNLYYMRI